MTNNSTVWRGRRIHSVGPTPIAISRLPRWRAVLMISFVVSLTLMLLDCVPSFAQGSVGTDPEKRQLEIEKLRLEIERLRADPGFWAALRAWIDTAVLPIGVLVLGWYLNRQVNAQKKRAEDEARRYNSMVDERLKAYSSAFRHLKPTALFFPSPGESIATSGEQAHQVLTKEVCRQMGENLVKWYFGDGGVLMSKKSKIAYFDLVNGLERAANAENELLSQTFREHVSMISFSKIEEYRNELSFEVRQSLSGKEREKEELKTELTRREMINDFTPDDWMPTDLKQWPPDFWEFGKELSNPSDAQRFRDFVFIQALASGFRDSLTKDIESRHPPGGQ